MPVLVMNTSSKGPEFRQDGTALKQRQGGDTGGGHGYGERDPGVPQPPGQHPRRGAARPRAASVNILARPVGSPPHRARVVPGADVPPGRAERLGRRDDAAATPGMQASRAAAFVLDLRAARARATEMMASPAAGRPSVRVNSCALAVPCPASAAVISAPEAVGYLLGTGTASPAIQDNVKGCPPVTPVPVSQGGGGACHRRRRGPG